MKHLSFFILFSCLGMAVFLSPVSAATRPDGFFDPLILQNTDGSTLTAAQAFEVLKKGALTVSSPLLERFPTQASTSTKGMTQRLYHGKLLVTTHDPKTVWFVSPQDGKRYYFNGEDDSYRFFQLAIEQAIPQDKWIFISLSTQKLEQRIGNTRLAEYIVSSGKPSTPTPTGFHAVRNKNPRAWSRMAGLWMPQWMAFTARGHGIHELPVWPSGRREGEKHLGKPVSHGCVRLAAESSKTIYDWTDVGTPVVIVQ